MGRQVYDMISDMFFFKNGQKRPKTVKKGFFFFFFLLVFPLLCRHFICCSLKRSKVAKNGQKWLKIAQIGIFDRFFGPEKLYPPGVNHTSRGWIFLKISAFVQNYPNSNFTVCDRLRSPSKRVFFSVFPKKCFFYAFLKKKKKFFFAKNDLWVTWEVWFSFRVVTMCFDAIRAD